ncbi:hypothetical protein AVDCRST_MAG94-4447 [uncultured Leptolyngbya sp.]|uniref:N-acetyltransferase domain-containing protein n=1 Tax=uncultured Leptolyngbya sp. TaxID=332963 RepID=A0A6J4N4H9_9CYAN|nr:hypothetical protein AVDCRST_MAG94-4447 [uncultured Leptolyngbya sp.]
MQVPGTRSPNRYIKVIEYGSSEYLQAAQLRYRLFYQNHNIPFESIFDEQEQQDLHVVIITSQEHRILAYGRLAQNSSNECQIYQLVVEPEFQGQRLGSSILKALAEVALQRGTALLVLNARVTQTGFYQKFGFEPVGEVFASSMTGVPHIKMQKKLMYSPNE